MKYKIIILCLMTKNHCDFNNNVCFNIKNIVVYIHVILILYEF